MRLGEITNDSRKTINYLNSLYIKYTVNSQAYDELILELDKFKNSDDLDIVRSVQIIDRQLKNHLKNLLSRKYNG